MLNIMASINKVIVAQQNEIIITHVLTKSFIFLSVYETSIGLYMNIQFIFKTLEYRGITHNYS